MNRDRNLTIDHLSIYHRSNSSRVLFSPSSWIRAICSFAKSRSWCNLAVIDGVIQWSVSQGVQSRCRVPLWSGTPENALEFRTVFKRDIRTVYGDQTHSAPGGRVTVLYMKSRQGIRKFAHIHQIEIGTCFGKCLLTGASSKNSQYASSSSWSGPARRCSNICNSLSAPNFRCLVNADFFSRRSESFLQLYSISRLKSVAAIIFRAIFATNHHMRYAYLRSPHFGVGFHLSIRSSYNLLLCFSLF